MTAQKLVEKYKHQIGGMILDGSTPRDGPARSLWFSQIMGKVEAVLGQIHADMSGPAPSSNGVASPPKAVQPTGGKSG